MRCLKIEIVLEHVVLVISCYKPFKINEIVDVLVHATRAGKEVNEPAPR